VVGLLPRHILEQGDTPWVATHTSKTLQYECIMHQTRQKLTQSRRNKPKRTHPGTDNPVLQGNRAGAEVLIYSESKDPPDPCIDLHIRQLGQEGAVGIAGPWIPPHCHLPPPEWLDTAADEGVEEVRTHQPISDQTLVDASPELQLTGVFLSHHVPPAGLSGRAPTSGHRERCVGVIP
jgi:hypothetical protein